MTPDERRSRLADLKMLEYATPALRTLLAFCLYLRFGQHYQSIDTAYDVANEFIERLKGDYQP